MSKFHIRPLLLFLTFCVAGGDAKGLRGKRDNGTHAAANKSVQVSEDSYDNHLQRHKNYGNLFLKRDKEDEADAKVIYLSDPRNSTAES